MGTAGSTGRLVRFGAIAGLAVLAAAGLRDHWLPLFANPTATDGPAAPKATRAKRKGVPVIVAPVGEMRDAVVLQAIGTARAVRSVVLYPEAAGEITDLPVQSGTRVAKDDVVLRLDSRDARLAMRVAETHVREAQNELARAKDLQRSKVKSAANVVDAELGLERARLELRQAQETLADRTLRAPFAGVVGIPKVEVGDRITPETAIVSLDDRSTLSVEFEVAERFFTRLRSGMPVRARTPAFADRRKDGVVDKIDSRIDPVARTILLRATFPNADDALRPGMSFAATIDLPGPLLPAVPELSLQWRDGRSYVWRISDGTAERVGVVARRRLADTVLVEGDLNPGDTVVVEGVQRLRPGVAVYRPAGPGG